jgi:uncharacterized membrane protein YdfJ with MMPL/SSD domain
VKWAVIAGLARRDPVPGIQVGFTVALGLLLLIRIFLVPSIALLLRSRAI